MIELRQYLQHTLQIQKKRKETKIMENKNMEEKSNFEYHLGPKVRVSLYL